MRSGLHKGPCTAACTDTMPSVEPNDSNKQPETHGAVLYRPVARPVLLPRLLHYFWQQHIRFRDSKHIRELD